MDSDSDALRRMMDITSDARVSYEGKLESLLRLGCEYLGVELGFMTRIEDGTQLVVAAVGDHDLLQPGERCPLSESYCRRTIEATDSLTVQQASAEGWADDPAYATFGLEAYVGARVELDGDLYGTFCFADSEARETAFDESEVVFVELLAEWVSHELARQAVVADLERERDRLEEFASVVSHDLRNPLSVATGQLNLERERHGTDSDHLSRVVDALDRMDVLLSDLLTLSKAGAQLGSREPVSLAELAARSWETVETGAATLHVETTRTVEADPVRLTQLFENLFRNSVEHSSTCSQSGGQASETADPSVTVTVRNVDGGFAVDDDGPGIPQAERSKVTSAGYTTVPDGTGFGLHIVAQIVQAHGWHLEVTGSPSGGTRFAITGVDHLDESPELIDVAGP